MNRRYRRAVYDELCWYMNSCLWLQAWLSAALFPPTPLPHNTIWFLLVYLFTCLFSSHTVASVGIGKSFLFNFIHWFKNKTKHKNTDSFPVMQSCQCLFNTVVLRNLQKYRHNYDLNKAMSDQRLGKPASALNLVAAQNVFRLDTLPFLH